MFSRLAIGWRTFALQRTRAATSQNFAVTFNLTPIILSLKYSHPNLSLKSELLALCPKSPKLTMSKVGNAAVLRAYGNFFSQAYKGHK